MMMKKKKITKMNRPGMSGVSGLTGAIHLRRGRLV